VTSSEGNLKRETYLHALVEVGPLLSQFFGLLEDLLSLVLVIFIATSRIVHLDGEKLFGFLHEILSGAPLVFGLIEIQELEVSLRFLKRLELLLLVASDIRPYSPPLPIHIPLCKKIIFKLVGVVVP